MSDIMMHSGYLDIYNNNDIEKNMLHKDTYQNQMMKKNGMINYKQ